MDTSRIHTLELASDILPRGGSRKWTATYLETLPPRAAAYSDPGQQGLLLLVRRHSRSWVLRYQFKKVEKRIVLGHFPATGLHAARDEAKRLLGLLREQGIDPGSARPSRKSPPPHVTATAGNKHSIDFLIEE